MIPPKVRGRIHRIAEAGKYTVKDTVMELVNNKNQTWKILENNLND